MILIAALLAAAPAAWFIDTTVDEMTDIRQYGLRTRGPGGQLVFSCHAGDPTSFRVGISADNFVGYRFVYARDLTYRVDSDPAVTEAWPSTGSTALMTSAEKSLSLFTRMLSAKTVLFRMKDADGNLHDLRFDLSAMGPKSPEFFGHCKDGAS